MKEASARIKINKLLENAGWRFFTDGNGPANIQLEPSVKLTQQDLDSLGVDFEKAARGFIDFLLLDIRSFPLIVLEAKAEDKNPLVGKEQARKYARSQNCRYIILSNGNLHYFWDLERGNPYIITSFPSPESVVAAAKIIPDRTRILAENIAEDYIILTQRPSYASEAAWINELEREVFEKPEEYYTLDKLRRAASVDRRLSLREILEKIFGLIPRFKSKDELLEEEFAKFIADQKPDEANVIPALKQFFKAYVTNGQVRDIIESKRFTELYTTSAFTTADLKAVPLKYRKLIPEYVKDYVSLNQFVA